MTTMTEWLLPALSLILLAIGLACMLTRKRVIKQVIGLSIMLQGALVSIMDAGFINDRLDVAQSMIVSSLVVEAIVLAIALALIVNVFRYYPRGHIDDLDKLKG